MATVSEMLNTTDLHDEAYEAAWRLWRLAEGKSGGGEVAADVLLGTYNGTNFPFDMSQLMRLDHGFFSDSMTVMMYFLYRQRNIRDHMGITADDFMRLAARYGRLPKSLEGQY